MINVWNNLIGKRELECFGKSVDSRYIMEGPVLREFEGQVSEVLGAKYAIGTSSGTAALTLSLMGINIKPGDEVIVPDITFIATANAAHILGARVIVAPVDKEKLTLDFQKVDELITYKTKAIITVDLNGRISCSRDITEKYNKKGIMVITDACQAFMSECQEGMAGTLTNMGCFSFGITKTLTTIQGGMVVTDDQNLYERMKFMKTQGMSSVFEGRYMYAGYNFKLPDVLAAIGLGQMERLADKRKHMKLIDALYREELNETPGVSFLPRSEKELVWMPEIVCQNRDKVRNILMENNVLSRPLYEPLHTAGYLESPAIYEEVKEIQRCLLMLPGGPDQSTENIHKVIKILNENDLV